MRNLLTLEIRRRRDLGEQPAADEYIGLFPHHSALIRQSFLESTSLSRTVDSKSPVEAESLDDTIVLQAIAGKSHDIADLELVARVAAAVRALDVSFGHMTKLRSCLNGSERPALARPKGPGFSLLEILGHREFAINTIGPRI